MADQLKPYRFKPGQVANPGGRPKLPDDIKEARNINQIEFERIMNRYLFLPADELSVVIGRPETTVLERLVGTILLKGVKRGDVARAEWALNRTLGKVKDRLQIESQSVRLTGRIPSTDELSLDNPNLTMAQLEAFQEKLAIIQTGLAEKGLALPEPETIDAEAVDDQGMEPE